MGMKGIDSKKTETEKEEPLGVKYFESQNYFSLKWPASSTSQGPISIEYSDEDTGSEWKSLKRNIPSCMTSYPVEMSLKRKLRFRICNFDDLGHCNVIAETGCVTKQEKQESVSEDKAEIKKLDDKQDKKGTESKKEQVIENQQEQVTENQQQKVEQVDENQQQKVEQIIENQQQKVEQVDENQQQKMEQVIEN